jgi:hypothetical protein
METYKLPFTSEVIEQKLQLIDENANKLLTDKDLENLAKKSELPTVPTKISQLTNDKGYITGVPSEYITESELSAKKYATESFVTSKIAEASGGGGEVDLSGYVTEDELAAKGYITDISSKADKNHTHSEYLTEHQSLAGYAEKSYVTETLNTALASKNFLPSCSTPNEGQFLRVVGGVATWTNIAEAEEATF